MKWPLQDFKINLISLFELNDQVLAVPPGPTAFSLRWARRRPDSHPEQWSVDNHHQWIHGHHLHGHQLNPAAVRLQLLPTHQQRLIPSHSERHADGIGQLLGHQHLHLQRPDLSIQRRRHSGQHFQPPAGLPRGPRFQRRHRVRRQPLEHRRQLRTAQQNLPGRHAIAAHHQLQRRPRGRPWKQQ